MKNKRFPSPNITFPFRSICFALQPWPRPLYLLDSIFKADTKPKDQIVAEYGGSTTKISRHLQYYSLRCLYLRYRQIMGVFLGNNILDICFELETNCWIDNCQWSKLVFCLEGAFPPQLSLVRRFVVSNVGIVDTEQIYALDQLLKHNNKLYERAWCVEQAQKVWPPLTCWFPQHNGFLLRKTLELKHCEIILVPLKREHQGQVTQVTKKKKGPKSHQCSQRYYSKSKLPMGPGVTPLLLLEALPIQSTAEKEAEQWYQKAVGRFDRLLVNGAMAERETKGNPQDWRKFGSRKCQM